MSDRRESGYTQRVIQQTQAWVAGNAAHNVIDNECCPDFSCCRPEMFMADRGERMRYLNKLLTKHGLPARHDS